MAASALALLAGCGSSSYSSSSNSKSTGAGNVSAGGSKYAQPSSTAANGGANGHKGAAAAASTGASAAGLAVASKSSKLGTILAAGPKKMTVYMFEADKGSQSACSGACAGGWPPVTSAGAAIAAGAARTADLGTITRSDGTKQVTYAGHPLYFFVKDKDGGDAYGQGSKAFGAGWYVLAPSGSKIDKS
jgi:predicted lipoprotein with Yx(FWY)xxD motif